MSENGFAEYKRVIIFRLDQQDEILSQLVIAVKTLSEDVSNLKGRFKIGSLITGFIGGSLMGFALKFIG